MNDKSFQFNLILLFYFFLVLLLGIFSYIESETDTFQDNGERVKNVANVEQWVENWWILLIKAWKFNLI